MFGKDNGKETTIARTGGPVKTGNSDQQKESESPISLPNGCDQDFVFYED